ncbi:hypothetical protein L0222_06420 [bacterium]|nr:hypothetical protein [bacterium]MCI0605987.1 hypothetical protein [bacterium]
MKKLVGGGLLIFFGLFMLFGVFVDTTPPAFMIRAMVAFLFAFVPIAVGGLMIRSHSLSNKKSAEESRKSILASREKEILRLAKQKGGELTLPDIVSETSMNTEEADEIMRELVVKRYVDMKITNQGTVIYEFFELVKDKPEERILRLESWTDDRDVN